MPRAQVLGVEALHTKDVRHTHHLLVKHLATIRDMPVFKHCRIVLIFEYAFCNQQNNTPQHSSAFAPCAGRIWPSRASTCCTPSTTRASRTGWASPRASRARWAGW